MKNFVLIFIGLTLTLFADETCIKTEKEIKLINEEVQEHFKENRIISACNEMDRVIFYIKEYKKNCKFLNEEQKKEYENILQTYNKKCR